MKSSFFHVVCCSEKQLYFCFLILHKTNVLLYLIVVWFLTSRVTLSTYVITPNFFVYSKTYWKRPSTDYLCSSVNFSEFLDKTSQGIMTLKWLLDILQHFAWLLMDWETLHWPHYFLFALKCSALKLSGFAMIHCLDSTIVLDGHLHKTSATLNLMWSVHGSGPLAGAKGNKILQHSLNTYCFGFVLDCQKVQRCLS